MLRTGAKRPKSRPSERPASVIEAERPGREASERDRLPVGTRVRLSRLPEDAERSRGLKVGVLGTVRRTADRREVGGWVGVEWDGLTDGNNLGGNCKQGAGWWVGRKFLEVVTTPTASEVAEIMAANPGTTPGGREARERSRRRFIESRRGEDRTRKAKLRYNPETGRLEKR